MMDSNFIVVTLETYIWEDILRTVPCLRSLLHVKHKHWVFHYKIWDAKQKAVATIYGDFDESYIELPRFLTALKEQIQVQCLRQMWTAMVCRELVCLTMYFGVLVHVLKGSSIVDL